PVSEDEVEIPRALETFDVADSIDETRTVEEALANDFLFAFDQREENDDVDAPGEREASASEFDSLENSSDQSTEQEPDALRAPSNEPFALTRMQGEREQLEQEIGKLRRELERHRGIL